MLMPSTMESFEKLLLRNKSKSFKSAIRFIIGRGYTCCIKHMQHKFKYNFDEIE